MNWLAFVAALVAIVLFCVYAFTAQIRFLGFGLAVTVFAWIVQLVVHTGEIIVGH